MKVSLNWVKMINERYKTSAEPASHGVDELVEKIGRQLGEVEEVVDLGKKYKGILVAKVITCEKHPNADKLSVCMIDAGKTKPVQVVCGAPNVKAGQTVAWIPPGVAVPSSYDKDPFVIEAREIRGVMSHGMIASAKELAFSDNHEGILVIEEDVKPGTSFADVFQLNDYIIDIENKMFTHRPDCFGMLGIAREVAGIQGHMFVSPPIYKAPKTTGKFATQRLPVKIKNEVPDLVPRFVAQVFRDIKVGPSQAWMRSYLSRVGIRPINNIVDITNYFMMLTAQPLHAYDYDKVKKLSDGDLPHIVIRQAKKSEKLTLLGNKTIELNGTEVVIATDKQAIGLGGVMGGADTEVDERTKTIILEVANFDMNTTRLTAMTHGLFTDAATRFTKNQSPWQCEGVLAWANGEIIHQAGGVDDGMIYDLKGKLKQNQPVKLSAAFINSRLGTNLTAKEMKKILENVEFEVNQAGENLNINAPFWRTDIEIAEDVVEEVGRLYGYDKLPLELPPRDLTPVQPDPLLQFKVRLRHILAAAGANEAMTHSFVNDSLLEAAGQDPKDAYHIRNALSPDLQYYRISLTPSLLDKIQPNIRAGFDKFFLFELGKGHMKGHLDNEKLPRELERLSLVFASQYPGEGSAYFVAKHMLEYLLSELNIKNVQYQPLESERKYNTVPYYEPKRGANIMIDGKTIGRIGEFKHSVRQAFKLPKYCAGFDVHTDELLALASPSKYQPLNRFPSLEQDFCLRSKAKISYQQLTDFVDSQLKTSAKAENLIYRLSLLDIYQRPNDQEHKQTTWHIELAHPQRTLTTAESNRILDEVATAAKTKLGAERI